MDQLIESAVDQRLVKAIAHPLRFKLLTALNDGVASPSELAERLGERLGNVSYHVRILADLGCIELVRTRPVRGAVEHYYRATMRSVLSDDDWRVLPASVRRSIVGGLLTEIWGDVAAASESGAIDAPETHVTRTELVLDEEGAADLRSLLIDTLERAMDIHAKSAGRIVDGGNGGGQGTKLVILHFGSDPAPAAS